MKGGNLAHTDNEKTHKSLGPDYISLGVDELYVK